MSATDKAAALAAKLRAMLPAEPRRWQSIEEVEWSVFMSPNEWAGIIAALESSRPAQDIVAEMREKVEALKSKTLMYHPQRMFTSNLEASGYNIGHYDGIEDVLTILSPTKNTAPTEAEEL